MTTVRINLPVFRETMQEQQEAARSGPTGSKLVTRAKIRPMEDQLKETTVGEYTIFCDAAKTRRGGGRAPSPLQYFVAAVGF
jgi:hypothetical protein